MGRLGALGLVLALLLGCGDQRGDGYYHNPDVGLGIRFPSSWGEQAVPRATFATRNPEETATCTVLVQELPPGTTLERLATQAVRRGQGLHYRRASHEAVSVSGVDGYESRSSFTVSGQPFRNAELHLVRDGTGITIQCTAHADDWAALEPTVERILASVSLS